MILLLEVTLFRKEIHNLEEKNRCCSKISAFCSCSPKNWTEPKFFGPLSKKSLAGKLVPLSFGFGLGFGFGPPRNRRIRECRRIFFAQSDDIKLALSQAAWLSILKENQLHVHEGPD